MTPAEARSLAAQLTAAADSDDMIGQDAQIMRRLEKIAERLGVDIQGLAAPAIARGSARHPPGRRAELRLCHAVTQFVGN